MSARRATRPDLAIVTPGRVGGTRRPFGPGDIVRRKGQTGHAARTQGTATVLEIRRQNFGTRAPTHATVSVHASATKDRDGFDWRTWPIADLVLVIPAAAPEPASP